MPRKLRELRRDLHHTGWRIDRQKGSHQRWKHPLVPGYQVSLAGADGSDAKPYMEESVQEAVDRANAAQKALEQQRKQKGQQP